MKICIFNVNNKSFVISGNRGVKEDEFIEWMTKSKTDTNTSVIKNAFQALDIDQDGFLSKVNLQFPEQGYMTENDSQGTQGPRDPKSHPQSCDLAEIIKLCHVD